MPWSDGIWRALENPDRADFYTSGRASNEAAFLYQLFVRRFGTNNFPDCSNMCHEATSVGLPQSIGIGKGTVLLEDFDETDAIFVIGQNPGTNSPRMMTSLREASRRGVPIVAINPLRERALERFAAPQDPIEMATFTSTPISSEYCQVSVGGDLAVLKGMMKLVLAAHDAAIQAGGEPVLDLAFIAQHTTGLDALVEDLRGTSWDDILRVSGLQRAQIERIAQIYMQSKSVIICYGMGITQHWLGTETVQQVANLLLLRGNFGRPWRRHLPGARPFQRAGRPDRRDRREAEHGVSWPDRDGLRLPPATAPRPFGGGHAAGDDRRPVRRVRQPWRELRRRHAGRRDRAGGDAAAETDRRDQHEAQSRPCRARPGGADPPVPGAQRHRHAGGRPPERHG